MTISSYFLQLRPAYQAEMDDMTFDSEGHNVLRQRLAARRKEVAFLVQMMELSPEMVAVVFHQGFVFPDPAVMDHLVSLEPRAFPAWSQLSHRVQLTPWAQELSRIVLKEPMGPWFLTVAAALEYLYAKPDTRPVVQDDHDDDDEEGNDSGSDTADGYMSDPAGGPDGDDERDERAREEAGADWMAEQGFDRKDPSH
jgi:hypothetical protein